MANTRRPRHTKKSKPKPKPTVGPGTSRRHNPIHQVPGTGDETAPPSNLPPQQEPGTPPPPAPTSNPFSWMGLPPDVAAKAAAYLKDDPTGDTAMAYIRTTPWYAEEYAGINDFVNNGKIHDSANPEREYQTMKGNIRNSYQKYYGRLPTSQEIQQIAQYGWDDNIVEQKGQGYSIAQAQGGEWGYATGAFGGGPLSESDMQSLGEQQAGFKTTGGALIEQKVQNALAKMQRVFEGQQSTSLALEQGLGDIVKKRQGLDVGA